MHAGDLEIGPIERTFDDLFRSIAEYFNSAQVEPTGSIKERDLSEYSQQNLRNTLNKNLKRYGFHDLPESLRIIVQSESRISGLHRSDNITTYDELMSDGSHRTFNFYKENGPDNMYVSYYWLDLKKNGEQTQGVLTTDDRFYLHIITRENDYYLRIERAKSANEII